MISKLIVLAGGLATRILPLTYSKPKYLLPILGKPFVDYQFDLFQENSLFDITFCLGHLGNEVQNHIVQLNKHTFSNSFRLDFSHDGPQRLGTGGAIAKSLPTFSGNFAVMYGDSYITANLQEIMRSFHDDSGQTQITVTRNVLNPNEHNVVIQEGILEKVGKNISDGTHAEYGFTLVNRNNFENFIESNSQQNGLLEFDFLEFLMSELKAKKLAYYETRHPYWEIGSFDGIDRFEKYIGGNSDDRN